MRGAGSWFLGMCAIAKNEGRYLREWLEWHRMIGIEHFFLYDNESDDDTARVLAPYIEQGLVDYQLWDEHPGQLSAYADCIGRVRQRCTWIAFVDLDEFLVPGPGLRMSDLLAQLPSCNGLGVNWLQFGPSGWKDPPAGLQIASYCQRSADDDPDNRYFKSIVRTARVLGPSQHPHGFQFLDSGFLCDEDGRPILHETLTSKHSSRHVRINHYYTRSESEFARKLLRGNADQLEGRPADLASAAFYQRFNRVRDERMLAFVPALTARLEVAP
jgi:hypothetical protein